MRQALTGYSYQHDVTFLFLAKMDVEHSVKKIHIEAKVDHNFDDIHIESKNNSYFIQIKDFANFKIEDLEEANNKIKIGNKWHLPSSAINIIFFKEIEITTNCKILGLDAFKHNQTYIISMNREEIVNYIEKLYHINSNRQHVIHKYLKKQLDERIWDIDIIDLPSITLFDKKLVERSINVGRKKMEIEGMLFVEGKPGVGKSHYVNELVEVYKKPIVYRFWINNQDKDRENRLKYGWFLFDISKELYGDQKKYSERQIINKLKSSKKTIVIDGLDHVENYNPQDLDNYISFIDKIRNHNQVIVLSRPLVKQIKWPKYVLGNWTQGQTEKLLKELYFIDDYVTMSSIFSITKGYPILVRYIAEHFKKYKKLPDVNELSTVDEYYDQIINGHRGLRPFSLFLCSNAFHMYSEIKMLMGNEAGEMILEFTDNYPYLFEIRLNRIALFHDSFNTYLRKNISNYTVTENRICQLVSTSILSGESRYLSRINAFNIKQESKIKIFKQYSDIDYFAQILSKTLDIEALKSFYKQLQETLIDLDSDKITLIDIYGLSLILNILNRDHVSTSYEFLYTYMNYLLFAGYSEEDITSNGSLFSMLVYIGTGDDTEMYNLHSDNHYHPSRFSEDLKYDIEGEDIFFRYLTLDWPPERIKELISQDYDENFYERWKKVLTILYIQNFNGEFMEIRKFIDCYINDNEDLAIYALEHYFENRNFRITQVARILRDSKDLIFSLGFEESKNDYLQLDFDSFLLKNKDNGSFSLWVVVLNYIRLALFQQRKIEIHHIHRLWSKYHNRHDYSLTSIDEVLPIFENLKLLKKNQSIDLITDIQNQSEKGYRNLLVRYIENRPVSILKHLKNNYIWRELHIDWFDLSPIYIDNLPDIIFRHQIDKILYYRRHSMEIDIIEVLNVLLSAHVNKLKIALDEYLYTIRLKQNEKKHLAILRKNKIKYKIVKEDNTYKRETSRQRFSKGILLNEDITIVKRHISSPSELAKYTDDYYTALTQIDLYKAFDKLQVKKELKQVFINSLTTKSNNSKYFGNLFYFPGNLIKMINEYDQSVDLEPFFQNFKKYIELSSFSIDCS